MQLKELGEFGLIAMIRDKAARIPSPGCEGIGDDCAVIPAGESDSLVVTTDMLVEDIHFLRSAAPAYQLGRKSLAVNLSDVAAMGACPVASFLSVSLPPDVDAEWASAFTDGYLALSGEFGVPLLGGDTTASADRIAISVTAVGRVRNDRIKRRSAALPGDVVLVSGELGGSAQGLRDILSGRTDTEFARLHHDPAPCVREGAWLGACPGVHAMMDLSDGLASDLGHILKASGVGAEIFLDRIPARVPAELAVTGGEDYRLLLTAAAEQAGPLRDEYLKEFGRPLYEIGKIGVGHSEIQWFSDGKRIRPDWKGFRHF